MSRSHGMYGSPTYISWNHMKGRCLNPKNRKYANYGGRGIKICEEWINSFSKFHTDMGDRPKGFTLERIDNNGDYEPNNCKWATWDDQVNNRRKTVFLTHNGQTKCIADWARELGCKRDTLLARLNRGWSDDKILSTPV